MYIADPRKSAAQKVLDKGKPELADKAEKPLLGSSCFSALGFAITVMAVLAWINFVVCTVLVLVCVLMAIALAEPLKRLQHRKFDRYLEKGYIFEPPEVIKEARQWQILSCKSLASPPSLQAIAATYPQEFSQMLELSEEMEDDDTSRQNWRRSRGAIHRRMLAIAEDLVQEQRLQEDTAKRNAKLQQDIAKQNAELHNSRLESRLDIERRSLGP